MANGKNGNGAPKDPLTGQPMKPANYGPKPEMGKTTIGIDEAVSHPIRAFETWRGNRERNKRLDWEAKHNTYGRQANPRGNAKTNNDTRGSR